MVSSDQSSLNIQAQAELHHALLLGLQLMVSTNRSPEEVGDWMFRLFGASIWTSSFPVLRSWG